MVVVDTSVWIDYFNGKVTPQTDWLDSVLGEQIVIIGDLILTEVLQGFQTDRDFKAAQNLLLGFPIMNMLGKDLAMQSAANYRYLRKKGVTVRKTIDVIIGTFCIHHGFSLLHDDRDFFPLEKYSKLKTVNI